MEYNPYSEKIKTGEILFSEGRIDEAFDLFSNVLNKDPDNIEALNDKAVILNHTGDVKSSIEIFLRILEIDGNNIDAAYNLVKCYIQIQERENAAMAFSNYSHLLSKDDLSKIQSELNELFSLNSKAFHEENPKAPNFNASEKIFSEIFKGNKWAGIESRSGQAPISSRLELSGNCCCLFRCTWYPYFSGYTLWRF